MVGFRMKIRLVAASLMASAIAGSAFAQGSGAYYPPSGFDLSAIDPSTKPGNDFFQYANGKYLERAIIPADRPTVSRRFEMTDRMEANVHNLLQQAASGAADQPTDVRGKAGAFYASYMDEPRIDRVGIGAIAPELDAIRGATNSGELAALMGQAVYGFYPAIATPYIDSDLKAPERYAIYLRQTGLGMPDSDY
jgi:putative endopeptidase